MDVKNEFVKLVARQLGVQEKQVTDDAKLSDDLGADSLDLVEIIMEAEECFELEITDEDAENVQTVSEGISLIERLRAK